jgi:hypothetical protein
MNPRCHSSRLVTAAVALPRAAALCVALVITLLGGPAVAQTLVPSQQPVVVEPQDDPGHFEVVRAGTELRDGVYFLSARIGFRLSTEARDALHSGVPLGIRIDVEILHPRRWWFDNESAGLRQSFQLEYHALSERYTVLHVNSSEQASFGTLTAALAHIGDVERLPLIDAAVLENERGYDVRLRAVLDQEQFPGPLRLLAFWRRDWSIASDWYRWRLVSE